MWSVKRLKLFATTLACACLISVIVDVVLTYLHTGMGWHYGVAYVLAMLCVLRVMLHGTDTPRRYTAIQPRSPERKSSVSRPNSRST
jgi:hypothetical protein